MATQPWNGACSPSDAEPRKSGERFPIGSEVLGKYVVERKLGEGGMGVVVAVRHKDLGCLHAMKVLLREMVGHEQIVLRFLREARAAASLRGEHIARVHDVGRFENGDPYMVMEYLEGKDLRAILRKGPLPMDVAVLYLLQVCEAVAEAHAAGIVHRDLKPANLYLTMRPNGSACIKVIDFGIAKISGDEADLTKNQTIGSLKYMGPDQILKSRDADRRADIWSLGVIAYELVVGRAPFGGPSQVDLISAILSDEPEPPSVWRKDLPPAIEAVILRCLRKNRDERFQSADELASALREAAGIAVDNHSAMRMPMPSVSIVVDTPPPAQPEENTRLETAHTIPGQTRMEPNWRVIAAAGAAAMTFGVVVMLVLALRLRSVGPVVAGEGMESPAEPHSATVSPALSAVQEVAVAPMPSATVVAMEQQAAKTATSAEGARKEMAKVAIAARLSAEPPVDANAKTSTKASAPEEVVSPWDSPIATAAASLSAAVPSRPPIAPSASASSAKKAETPIRTLF